MKNIDLKVCESTFSKGVISEKRKTFLKLVYLIINFSQANKSGKQVSSLERSSNCLEIVRTETFHLSFLIHFVVFHF